MMNAEEPGAGAQGDDRVDGASGSDDFAEWAVERFGTYTPSRETVAHLRAVLLRLRRERMARLLDDD